MSFENYGEDSSDNEILTSLKESFKDSIQVKVVENTFVCSVPIFQDTPNGLISTILFVNYDDTQDAFIISDNGMYITDKSLLAFHYDRRVEFELQHKHIDGKIILYKVINDIENLSLALFTLAQYILLIKSVRPALALLN